MLMRVFFGFSIGFMFAACDVKNPFVSESSDIASKPGPVQNPIIICCRCNNSSDCQAFPGNDCPAGWEPKQGFMEWQQN